MQKLIPGFFLEEPETNIVLTDDESPDLGPQNITTRHKRLKLMRESRCEKLMNIFPKNLQEGDSWHVISAGNIDATTYLFGLVENYGPMIDLYASTWTMARPDVELIDKLLTDGKIKNICIFTGEYFAARETGVYATLLDCLKKHGGQLRLFMNHAKILAMESANGDFFVVEGSANFTTNPRAEQTVVNASKQLYQFYKNWFQDLLKMERLHGEKFTDNRICN